jgi:hypothetical protein
METPSTEQSVAIINVTDILPYKFQRRPFPYQSGFRLLIGVVTAPTHEDARTSIRHTWGNLTDSQAQMVDVRFFVGQMDDNLPGKTDLERGLNSYPDVVRFDTFIENYHNLTRKAKEIFRWADVHNYTAVMKVDDDSFVNVDNLLEYVKINADILEDIYAGHINRREYGECKVHTNPASKWYMYDQYPFEDFPEFADGPGFLLGPRALQYLSQNKDLLYNYRCDDAAVGIWTDPLNLIKKEMRVSIYESSCSPHDVLINPVSASEMYTLHYSTDLCDSGYVPDVCLDSPCLCKGHPDRAECWQSMIDRPYKDIIPRL